MTQYKLAFLFVLLGLYSMGHARSMRTENRNTLFSSKVTFPPSFDTERFPLRVYYGGDILETEVVRNAVLFSINKAIYQITNPNAHRSAPIEFYLLFTKDKTPVFLRSANTVFPILDHYKLPADTPYKCFKITLFEQVDKDTGKLLCRWRIEPHTIENKIPLNTFRFIIDPALVSELKEEPSKAGSNNIKLPSIHLVDNVDALNNALDEAARLTLSVVMDADGFHGRPKKTHREHFRIGTIQVALCQDNLPRGC